ncbi:hypothetical protein BFS86_09175 [Shewanella algae]|nr:hypothetical protein BFS86_09175 [Shewanella algae]
MDYIKATSWSGKDLKGLWEVTRKIDGVRVIKNAAGELVSRNNKPLYNLNHLKEYIHDAEIFLGDWSTSVSAVRTQNGIPVPRSAVYDLRPDHLDPRLRLGFIDSPTADRILSLLEEAQERGDEGLVLRGHSGNKWLRVKPKETYDVPVTGLQAGTGKHLGRMGALLTPRGKVGTGFTDADRIEFQRLHDSGQLLGLVIEVEAMSLTEAGKFRHPRFLRVRWDKTA